MISSTRKVIRYFPILLVLLLIVWVTISCSSNSGARSNTAGTRFTPQGGQQINQTGPPNQGQNPNPGGGNREGRRPGGGDLAHLPEPASIVLLTSGLVGLGLGLKKKINKK